MSASSVRAATRGPNPDRSDRWSRAWDRYWSGHAPVGPSRPSRFVGWALERFHAAGIQSPRVLDAGCGPGRDLVWLAQNGCAVVGVDSSRVAVRLARTRLRKSGSNGRSRVVLADLIRFVRDEPQDRFDAVVAAATYQSLSVSELLRLFCEIHRILRPGGIHAYSVRSTTHPGAAEPSEVAPNLPGDPVSSLTFFDRLLIERLGKAWGTQIVAHEVEPGPSWYVIQRKQGPRGDGKA